MFEEEDLMNPCDPCEGEGAVESSECPYCHGTGMAAHEEPHVEVSVGAVMGPVDCPDCDGVGCMACDGMGHVLDQPKDAAEEGSIQSDTGMTVPSGVVGEAGGFDKYMDRILSEEKRPSMNVLNDNPRRQRAASYQERPLGKIRMNGSK